MLKLSTTPFKNNLRLKLPETWHEKIIDFTSNLKFPYNFTLETVAEKNDNNETYYIFSSKMNKKLVLTEPVLRYFFGQRVEASNVGLSFSEYLPFENTKILITNSINPNQVIPAKMELTPELVILNGESTIGLDFRLNNLHGNAFSSINYYSIGNRHYVWKFILNPDQSYMTDYEKLLCDTLIHKDFFEKSCEKLINYLENEGALNHAKLLKERAKTHDNSKLLCEDEIEALSKIINDKSCLEDTAEQLSQTKKNAIKLHWAKNSHHPEYYKTPIDMSKIDIMEMCCDWYARALQYNNDFLVSVKQRQEERFHFPDFMFSEILFYCEVLASSDTTE